MTTQATPTKNVNLIVPPGIASYCFVIEPRKNEQNGKLEYSTTILYDKSNSALLDPLRKAIAQVAIEKFGPTAPQRLAQGGLRNPIRDGDTERADDKNYKGKLFVGMKSTRKPGIVDANKQEVFTNDDVYSGCLIRASVSVFAYDKAGNRGVALGLNNVQVLRKGDRLDGRKAAEDEFTEWKDPQADDLLG